MEQKLSKGQVLVVMFLEQQKEEARKLYNELLEAEQEQLAMIAKYYNLPVAEQYSLKKVEDGLSIFSSDPIASEIIEPDKITNKNKGKKE